MEKNEKLYIGVDGKYYQTYELANAYFLATGNSVWMTEDGDYSKQFEIWVYNLMGLSIQKVVNESDVSYEDFLRANQKILAVRAYRERNSSTLREAKDAMDKLQEELGLRVT